MSAVPSGGSIRSRFGRSAVPLITLAVGALAFAGFAVAKAVDSDPVVQRQVKVHAGLYELGTNTQDGTVWVAAVGSRLVEGARVVQLDGQTLEEKQSIDMDDAPGFGLAVNSRTGMLYTSNTRVGNMSAVNLETGEITIISDPDAEGEPHLYQVVADEENNMIYATVAQDPGQVWVVDGSTNTLDRVIETGGARPTGIVV
ncbi:MAG: hypothetical protein MJB57_08765, partial [Gemmatimonadetes bacterium]|nr:hypothetical protein [Gemmatimonadota bacterium]